MLRSLSAVVVGVVAVGVTYLHKALFARAAALVQHG